MYLINVFAFYNDFEKAYDKVEDNGGAAAHGSQRGLAHKFAHDNGVHGVVKLFKQRRARYGEEKAQQLFPYYACCQVIFVVSKFHNSKRRQKSEKPDRCETGPGFHS